MSFSLILQQEALDDLKAAFDYYESVRSDLGDQFIVAFREVAFHIEGNPFLFQEIYKDKRRAVITRFQYNIIYTIENDTVRVVAVMHSSMNPQRWEGRE